MNPKVDAVLKKERRWRKEFEALRKIALDCQLGEELKWGSPCYTLEDKNVVLIHGFKEYCAYLFFKGALLNNADGLLIQQTENVQSARQIRFTCLRDIEEKRPLLKGYIEQAIKVESAGLKVKLKKTADFDVPDELNHKFKEMPALKKAFESLTPGRQRAYLFHFSSAKQSKTRTARIEKCIRQILAGKGLDD